MIKNCKTCKKEFLTYPSRDYAKFCSVKCKSEDKKNKKNRKCVLCKKVFYPLKWTQTFCTKKCRMTAVGKDATRWKGEKAGYHAKHTWLTKTYGKPKKCDDCGVTKVRIEWANISHKYQRKRSDYKRLCNKCHYKFDRKK